MRRVSLSGYLAIVALCSCGSRTGIDLGDASSFPETTVDTASDTAVDTAPPPEDIVETPSHYGSVGMVADEARGTLTMSAYFSDAPSVPCGGPFVVGKCRVEACPTASGGLSAGTISISNTRAFMKLVPAMETGKAIYGPVIEHWPFVGPVPIQVSAPGATVPAFAGEILLPNQLTATEPADKARLSVDASEDLELRWMGGAPYALVVGMGPTETMVCLFAASTGIARVPAASLEELRSRGGSATVLLAVHALARTELRRDAWLIDLFAMRSSFTYTLAFR